MISRLALGLMIAVVSSSLVASASLDDIRPFGRSSWQEIQNAHRGKPLIVHIWGITCGPCRVEMPKWGAFLQKRRDVDLVVINADPVPDDLKAIVSLLRAAGLDGAENWIFSDPFSERLRFEIDPKWRGELPLTVLISRDGKRKTIIGVADLAEVGRWLDDQTRM